MTGVALRIELHSRDAGGMIKYCPEEVEWIAIRVAKSMLMVSLDMITVITMLQ